jgi:hypothetical protein
LYTKGSEIAEDKEAGGKRPEARQRCGEDVFIPMTMYAVIAAPCSKKIFLEVALPLQCRKWPTKQVFFEVPM